MENIINLIDPGMVVVIAVLYVLGMILKNTMLLKDKYIPLALGVLGILLGAANVTIQIGAIRWVELLFRAITQGILCAGVAVYGNQLIKQLGKDE